MCTLPPFLPRNHPQARHFLEDGTLRHIDTHFRLLREDLVAPVRQSLTALFQGGLQGAVNLPGSGRQVRTAGGGSSAAHLLVFRNVRLFDLKCSPFTGLEFHAEFDQLQFRREKTQEELLRFWYVTTTRRRKKKKKEEEVKK